MVNKTIALPFKLHGTLPRAPLITIYKSFLRPYLDYGDIIYDQPYNNSFCLKVESIQCNATIAITDAIRRAAREHFHLELRLEYLQHRRWYRKPLFFKLIKNQTPRYLFSITPLTQTRRFMTRNSETIPQFTIKFEFFKNSFFPPTINKWNQLDLNTRNSGSITIFKNNILKFVRPKPNSIFDCYNP